MKKICLSVLALCGSFTVVAQYSEADIYGWQHDTLTRHSRNIDIRPRDLADTLTAFAPKCYFEKKFRDSRRSDGGADLYFTSDDGMGYERRAYYLFPLTIRRPLAGGVQFEIDWMSGYPREDWGGRDTCFRCLYDPYEIYVRGDTLITATFPCETGGITSEGHRFRICGERVKRISARTCSVFSVEQGIDVNGRDDWGVPLGKFATPWVVTTEGAYDYVLPVISRVVLEPEAFSRFRSGALAVQREYLIEKRDSVIGTERDKEYRREALDRWQRRLPWPFESAETFTEMYVFVGFLYFLTELTVEFNDGCTEHYVHVATYMTNIP